MDASCQKHQSCFERTKAGNLVIRDEEQWNHRLRVFLNRVRYHLDNIPSQEVQVEHLFYDEFE